jgi:hypothetical protein
VEAHIFLCVLAYHLLIAIEKTLLDQGIRTSWSTVRDSLKTHQVCTIVLPTNDGSTLRIRKAATTEPDVLDLYRSLGVPDTVVKPQHTKIRPQSPRTNKNVRGLELAGMSGYDRRQSCG